MTRQLCHQTSYREIVNRRGSADFEMPWGGFVNDYVPFYFSPLTSFTFTIHKGNVPLTSPSGQDLGIAKDEDRIFLVCRVDSFRCSDLEFCFSDFPLNSLAPMPTVVRDLDDLESHVHWSVFDDNPMTAQIAEIGYNGVCKYFASRATPPTHQYRSQMRMAEFLVRDQLPMEYVECIIVRSTDVRDRLQVMMNDSVWSIPIYSKPECYF